MRAIAARGRGLPSDLEMVIHAGAETASTRFAVVGIATGAMASGLGRRELIPQHQKHRRDQAH
jgi:hypothetical protein